MGASFPPRPRAWPRVLAVHYWPDLSFSGFVCGVKRGLFSTPPSRWAGHLSCPRPLPSLPGPLKLWGVGPPGFGPPRRLLRPLAAPGLRRLAPQAPGGGSRPALSILLVPGHVGFTEEPTGPSAPLKRALEGESEAWRAGGGGGSVPASSAEPVFTHCRWAFQLFVSFFLLSRGASCSEGCCPEAWEIR